MAKALMGSFAPPRSVQLLDEVRALRQRVAELERRNRALLDAIEKRGGDDEGRGGGLFGRRR